MFRLTVSQPGPFLACRWWGDKPLCEPIMTHTASPGHNGLTTVCHRRHCLRVWGGLPCHNLLAYSVEPVFWSHPDSTEVITTKFCTCHDNTIIMWLLSQMIVAWSPVSQQARLCGFNHGFRHGARVANVLTAGSRRNWESSMGFVELLQSNFLMA